MKAVILLLIATGTVNAADYYVATTGRGSNPGSKDQPFRTIARGLAAARAPGDNVIVRQGIYPQTRTLNLANSGAEGKPITLRAFKGEAAIVDGTNAVKDANLVAVSAHHVRIKDLTIQNSAGTGIVVWGPGSRVHNVEVSGNTVHHCRRGGIYAGFNSLDDPVRDLLFEGNTVHHNVLKNEGRIHTSWDFGLGAGISKNVTIRKNVVFKNYGEGIGFYLADHGVAEENIVRDNFGVNIYLDNTTYTRVDRNLVYSTGDEDYFRFNHCASGIQIANEQYPGASNPSHHNVITNNILIGNRFAFYYGSYQRGGGLRHTLFANNTAYGSTGPMLHIDADDGHEKSRIVNNIFKQVGTVPITDIQGPTQQIDFQNNLWHGGVPQDQARSANDIFADPQFVNAGSDSPGGYRLLDRSPARKTGTTIDEAATDFGGRRRGNRADLGAWAFDPNDNAERNSR